MSFGGDLYKFGFQSAEKCIKPFFKFLFGVSMCSYTEKGNCASFINSWKEVRFLLQIDYEKYQEFTKQLFNLSFLKIFIHQLNFFSNIIYSYTLIIKNTSYWNQKCNFCDFLKEFTIKIGIDILFLVKHLL